MSGLEGYSYLQLDQLEELKKRLTVAQVSAVDKVATSQYNVDIGPNGDRVNADNIQFNQLAEL